MFGFFTRHNGIIGLGALMAPALAVSPTIADGQSWIWSQNVDGSPSLTISSPDADSTVEIRSDRYATVTVDQQFYGNVGASATTTIIERPGATATSSGTGRPAVAASATAIGNLMKIESHESTYLNITQRHAAGPEETGGGTVRTEAVAEAMTPEGTTPSGYKVNLDTAAISNYLKVNLVSETRDFEFTAVIDQKSDSEVVAKRNNDVTTADMAGREFQSPAPVAGHATSHAGAGSATAITNYTSLRFESGTEAGAE